MGFCGLALCCYKKLYLFNFCPDNNGKGDYIENKYLKDMKKGDFVYDVFWVRGDDDYVKLKDKFKKYDLPMLKKGPL